MELSHPLRVVTPTLDGDILRILAQAKTEFTPPEVHRLIGEHSVAGIRKGLERLVLQGIVLERGAGRASLYQLNRSHLAADAVVELAGMKEELISRLRRELTDWSIHPSYAALFGSAARIDMRADSDIDLVVIRPEDVDLGDDVWAEQIYQLSEQVHNWTGNSTNILELSGDELVQGVLDEDPVLVAINKEGIRIHGPSSYLRRRFAGAAA
jgi:predicted nucleotidyltransferase